VLLRHKHCDPLNKLAFFKIEVLKLINSMT
jgi:hypothetical protein